MEDIFFSLTFDDMWHLINSGKVEVCNGQFVFRDGSYLRDFTLDEYELFAALQHAGLATVPDKDGVVIPF